MLRFVLTAVLFALPLGARAQPLNTEDDKTLYAIGYLEGQKMSVLNLKPNEAKVVQEGFHDATTGAKAKLDVDQRRDAINKLAQARQAAGAEKEKTASKDFLAKAAQEKGAQKLPSGLVFKVIRPGKGPSPKETDQVKVNYEGRLINGTVFDSSYKRGQPAEFPLNGVIKCWTEGVQKMHVGEEAQLICPSDIAYGDRSPSPLIPAGSTLIFKVELLAVNGQGQ
ncbi:MAG TPA: FKBP-type peptidyl-prolyl cis-trans isomerase [Myxococcales bacterium]|jgi:FKBP-type peptidyl-prolyl cis-trans isomerase FkpA|nr:FKBP-type peptidyl-prolyl cis-trans isomerase [Myxococcales bacterium]